MTEFSIRCTAQIDEFDLVRLLEEYLSEELEQGKRRVREQVAVHEGQVEFLQQCVDDLKREREHLMTEIRLLRRNEE